jgi:triosephosphate isomerase (TIM)
MSRTPFVAGNWKMQKTVPEAVAFMQALAGRIPAGVDVAVCPAFTALADTARAAAGTGVAVYAQNMHQAEAGAFTGEVSAAMLLDAGADGVLVGHSERRQLFGETDAGVNEKATRAHAAGLRLILAVGETAEERDAALTEIVLERQVRAGLDGLDAEQVAATTIAYEPVWAIGTGLTATPEIAQAAHAFIRGLIDGLHGVGGRVRIQYGGSVKPGNAAELFAQPDIDGGLIGGASLEPGDFAAIVAAAAGG